MIMLVPPVPGEEVPPEEVPPVEDVPPVPGMTVPGEAPDPFEAPGFSPEVSTSALLPHAVENAALRRPEMTRLVPNGENFLRELDGRSIKIS
jgi:hypothetical protein